MGAAGRRAVLQVLPVLKRKFAPAFIIANAENAAHGRGITGKIANELFEAGIHCLTMGNHTWDNKEIFAFIDREKRMVRPANYPPGVPGTGVTVVRSENEELAVVNLQGRTFLPAIDCPFRTADQLLADLRKKHKLILVDFHAEATSEKIAMGWYLDGRVTAVVGTHTHVQTHDECVLPNGSAYVTDVGMVGSFEGVLGMEKDAVIQKFLTQLPMRFQVDDGKWQFHALLISADRTTGKANSVSLIRFRENELIME